MGRADGRVGRRGGAPIAVMAQNAASEQPLPTVAPKMGLPGEVDRRDQDGGADEEVDALGWAEFDEQASQYGLVCRAAGGAGGA